MQESLQRNNDIFEGELNVVKEGVQKASRDNDALKGDL